MKILLARIPEEGANYEGADPGAIMQVENDPVVRKTGDVRCELYVQLVSGELVVRGTLAAELEMRCARCSEFFSTTVAVSDFLRAYPAPKGIDSVDITEDLREEILLHVPAFEVCSPDCKGMCPRCGVDLNKGSCECSTEEGPTPWSALDNLSL